MVTKANFIWRTPQGDAVSCIEKLKVLHQNLEEFRAVVLDLLEDAALMGCDVTQVREALKSAVDEADPRFRSS